MELHYKTVGDESNPPLIILHGLMGMLDNWFSPAKLYADDFYVILVDQRNHGHSAHSSEMSYEAMSNDLRDLIYDLDYDSVHIIGHSMGGKTAMKFAQNYPDMVDKLVIADIAPRWYPVHHTDILRGLRAVDLSSLGRRGEADEVLAQYIPQQGVRQFLMKNLYWIEKGQLAWRFNLGVISRVIEDIGEATHDARYDGDTLFIRGGKSDYVTENELEEIALYFPNYELETIEDAGHWLHAEAPQLFVEKTTAFIKG